MRLEIPHSLGRDEVRRRIAARMDTAEDKASAIAGGAIDLKLDWTGDYTLSAEASAMGFTVPSMVDITPNALVFDVTIPPGMGFARGMIERTIHEKGEKLLA
jgi:hypothetical protein